MIIYQVPTIHVPGGLKMGFQVTLPPSKVDFWQDPLPKKPNMLSRLIIDHFIPPPPAGHLPHIYSADFTAMVYPLGRLLHRYPSLTRIVSFPPPAL